MTTRARRIDGNQPSIVDRLRRVPGVQVQVVSDCGGLGFDLIVRYQNRAPMLMEIKADDKSRLTVSEQAARKRYSPYWVKVTTFEEALEAIGIPQNGPPIPKEW